ncbi:MAG: FAD-dependent oxidoreductase [Streptosporangiales bacterium]|nr:FAD-dependent oxidoreductase [Streptosporangiales bacterium]
MKVIVVGGGIVGASCAYALARQGARVELLDAGDPPSGASARSDGSLFLGNKRPADVPLVRAALATWQRLLPQVGDIEFESNELLMVAQDEAQERALVERVAALRAAGVDVRELTGAQCVAVEPGLAPVRFGSQVVESRELQPMLATLAMLRLARAAGTTVRPHTRVQAVRPGEVRTADGTHPADEVVVAAGAWTGELLAGSGHRVPIEPRRGHVLVVERKAAELVRCGAMGSTYADVAQSADPDLHVVPLVTVTKSGTVLIGASRERVGLRDQVDPHLVTRMCAAAVSLYPGLASCRVTRSWVGFRPWATGGYPYVGRLAPGLSVAAGHEGEGITYGPYTGEVLASHLLAGADVPAVWQLPQTSDTGLLREGGTACPT